MPRSSTRQGVRLARWRDAKGKTKTAPVTTGKDGADRIRDESSTYVARYRDGDGSRRRSARPDAGTRPRLTTFSPTWSGRPSECGPGLLTPAEARTAEHLATPIGEHFDAYLNALAAAGSVPMHRNNVRTYLNRLAADCGFKRLADLTAKPWSDGSPWKPRTGGRLALATRTAPRSSPSRIGAQTPSIGRLSSNPFKGVPKADEKADPRRRRRSMTEAELVRLLDVARGRPLLEAMTVRRGKRKGQASPTSGPKCGNGSKRSAESEP